MSAPADMVACAIRWLMTAKPAVSGLDRDSHIRDTCRQIVIKFGLDTNQAVHAMADWGQLCSPPLSESDIARHFQNALVEGTGFESFSFAAIADDPATFAGKEHIATGLRQLDAVLGGLRVEGVSLVCGKPGQAKSTIAAQIVANAALAGDPVGSINLELCREDIAHLAIAQFSGIPRRAISTGNIRNGQTSAFRSAMDQLKGAPLYILDSGAFPGALDRVKLRALVRRGVEQHGWKLVLLDYLGLLSPLEREDQFRSDIENSTAIKEIAQECGVAMLVVSAMRKSATFSKPNGGKVPSLDEVTGAGRLTYDCTNCFYICNEIDGEDPNRGTVYAHCLKSRYSGAGKRDEPFVFDWTPATGRIVDRLAHYPMEDEL